MRVWPRTDATAMVVAFARRVVIKTKGQQAFIKVFAVYNILHIGQLDGFNLFLSQLFCTCSNLFFFQWRLLAWRFTGAASKALLSPRTSQCCHTRAATGSRNRAGAATSKRHCSKVSERASKSVATSGEDLETLISVCNALRTLVMILVVVMVIILLIMSSPQ